MKTEELLEGISGMQTIESVKKILGVSKNKAVYFIYRLRNKGYVKTKYSRDKKRVYYISAENALGGMSYVDILNKYSPIKLSTTEVYKIYGRNVTIEETIVYSVKTRKIRYILASLWLFKHIKKWGELYQLAKKNNFEREIGALYDLAVRKIPKMKKMNKKYRSNSLPSKTDKYKEIAEGMKSKDYEEIEKTWKVHLPLNEKDLEAYEK